MRDFWAWNFGCVYGSWWFVAASQLIDRITIINFVLRDKKKNLKNYWDLISSQTVFNAFTDVVA